MQFIKNKQFFLLALVIAMGFHNLTALTYRPQHEASVRAKISRLKYLAKYGSDKQKKEAAALLQEIEAYALSELNSLSDDDLLGLATIILQIIKTHIYETALPKNHLYYAAAEGNAELVEILLELGASPNATFPTYYSDHTALMEATKNGHTAVVEKLLKDKAIRINCSRNDNGDTALHYAAEGNRVQIATILLAAGACPNIKNRSTKYSPKEQTPYEVAEEKGNTKVAELLRAHIQQHS